MALIIQVGPRVDIHFFDGLTRCSWTYNNFTLRTDSIGEASQQTPSVAVTLDANAESSFIPALTQEFIGCDVSDGPLWQLNPAAHDYERAKLAHANDRWMRLSFSRIPHKPSKASDDLLKAFKETRDLLGEDR